jgi:hypothetical protein
MKEITSLVKIAFALVMGCAVLLPGSARAQTFPDVRGHYQGFSQSIGDPNVRGPAELTINFQNSPREGDFSGSLTLGGTLFNFAGKVVTSGIFDGRGAAPAGDIKVKGKWQDLTRGGGLALATYKFTPTVGPSDQGEVGLLRGFIEPPEPEMPPDIAGCWSGTFESSLSLMRGTAEWMIQQDRTEAGAPGTSFMGKETMDMGTAGIIINDFVGTIDGQGKMVRVGLSVRGFVICGGKVASGEVRAHSVRNFVDGGVDLVSMSLDPCPEPGAGLLRPFAAWSAPASCFRSAMAGTSRDPAAGCDRS